MENGKVFFLNHCPPPPVTAIPDKHDFIFIKEVHITYGVLHLGGGGVIHNFWYLGKGDEDDTKLFFFLLLTYLRSVLKFIKQYNDSMCFSSIFSWKLRIIPYLFEIDIRTPISFLSS